MKDLNSRMPILLKGIDRRPADGVPDGSLLDLINLRFTNDALRPVPQKLSVNSDLHPQFFIRYKHIISDDTVAYWGYANNYLAYAVYVNNLPVLEVLDFMAVAGPVTYTSVGNALVVAEDDPTFKTYVMLYQPDSNTYRIFDKLIPDMPLLTFQRTAKNTDDSWVSEVIDSSTGNTFSKCDAAFRGLAQEIFADRNKKGYFVGRYLVRCAWELFDGSIVMHNIPMLFISSDIDGMLTVSSGDQYWTSTVRFTGYSTEFKLNIPSADLSTLKTQYAGVVKSLNIYVSNHVPLKELSTAYLQSGHRGEWNTMTGAFTTESTNTWLTNEVNYFEVAKIGLANLNADAWTPFGLTDASLLSSGVVMPAGNLSTHSIYGRSLYSYNQRIFMGKIKNYLGKGISLYGHLFPASNTITGPTYSIGYSYDLDTADGTRRVFSGWQTYNQYSLGQYDNVTDADIFSSTSIGKTGKNYPVNGLVGYRMDIIGGTGNGQSRYITSNTATTVFFDALGTTPDATSDFRIMGWDRYQYTIHDTAIGYPDSRAKSMDIWHKDPGGVIRHCYTIALTQVFGMNFSFIMPINYFPLDTGVGYPKVGGSGGLYDVLPINENTTYTDDDRVQVSEFQNPFYFPAANSYRVEGTVMGMATNAVPLGSSQFGQFPVFVFTSKGIWTLDIGSGDVFISSIRPLSGVVCTAWRSILGIDSGVLFLSDQGLMMISGRDPVVISALAMGPSKSPLAGGTDYERIIDNPNTYQPKDYMDDIDFATYATAAYFAFVTVDTISPPQREIIVCNPNYDYSYVFNLESKQWYKYTESWGPFIYDYPKVYGLKYIDNSYFVMFDMSKEIQDPDHDTYPVMVHFETRPIRFGEIVTHKKLQRLLMYGLIIPAKESAFTFYIYGSVDQKNWFVQQASNITIPEQNIIAGRTTFSARSYIIVAGGRVYDNSYISGIVADIEKRYTNKLR